MIISLLLLLLVCKAVIAQELVYLDQLGQANEVRGRLLYPAHKAPAAFYVVPSKDSYAISYFHVPASEVDNVISTISMDSLLVLSVCSYLHQKKHYYVVNAGEGEGRHEVALNLTMDKLQETMRIRTENRVEVHHICAHGSHFDVVWHHAKNFVAHFMVQEAPLKEVLDEEADRGREGYYPDVLQPFHDNHTIRAIAVWRKGFGVKFRIAIESDGEISNGLRTGFRLNSAAPLDAFNHIAVWRDEGFSWRGRDVPKSMQEGSMDLSALDWEIESQMRTQEVPSVAIAVLSDGENFFVRAYGYANILNETTALPLHRFRIASISKTVTAMLITSLVNQGKLSYRDRVFGPSGILSDFYRGPTNFFLRSITVQHLLEHSSGAWSHFLKLEFTKRDLSQTHFLQYVLTNHQPRSPPGRVHVYSNIGYLFLGRIVEAVTGMTYERYAQQSLFTPLKISMATIARRQPVPDEVAYYSHDNASPYLSWDPERLDAAAGWSLRPTDVARVFDELRRHRFDKYRLMTVPGGTRWTYGRGVQIGSDSSLYHVGSMAGSESIALSRGPMTVAIIANLRGTSENWLTPWMESLARRIIGRFSR